MYPNRVAPALLAAALTVGCGSQSTLKRFPRAVKDPVKVLLADGSQREGRIHIGPDDRLTAHLVGGGVVGEDQIVELTHVQHGQGALDGLLVGGGVGFGLGLMFGLADGDDDCGEGYHVCIALSAGEKGLLLGTGLGLLGALGGVSLGALVGRRDHYERVEAPQISLVPRADGGMLGVSGAF